MMKRIFTLSLLMIAFVMNAVAQWNQDAKIEEVHWFGMHEFYNSPLYGINRERTDVTNTYLTNANFSQGLNGWNKSISNEFHDEYYGNIGSYAVWNNTNYSTTDDNHPNSMMCLGMECRWSGNYSSFYQEMSSLPAGSYKLTYDVQNGNSQTQSASYESLFYVEVNGTRYTDLRTEWKNGGTGWNTHTIEFVITGAAANAKISFGYGTGTNHIQANNTPALYVSNLKLERAPIEPSSENNTMITWSGNHLESLTVVKDWTGQEGGIQRPKTSFYSWLYHQLRFSVGNTSLWWFGSVTTGGSAGNNSQTDLSNYYGLKNLSGNGEDFTIHNLKAGDQINIEYNINNNNSNTAHLVSGSLSSMSANDPINSKENNELKYYTVSADGDVCINIPGGAVIRAVRIILKEYQVADMDVTELNTTELQTYLNTYGTYDSESSFGYRYTFKNPGVLEDKRGAVPYITMKFGNDNDMTFVRKLPEGSATYQLQENSFRRLNGFTVLAKNRGGDNDGKIITPEKRMTGDNYFYSVTNTHQENAGVPWDCQFWIGHEDLRNLPAGAKVRLHFRRRADNALSVGIQAQGPDAPTYISNLDDNVAFNTNAWEEITLEYTVTEAMAGKFQYFTFNLNDNQNNTIYFADIYIEVQNYTMEAQGSGNITYGATSIVNMTNEWDPDEHQYHIKNVLQRNFVTPTQPIIEGQRSAAELQDMFVGKEWSVFTADHDNDADYGAGVTHNGQLVVWRDIFNTIYPLSGNYFYFFPEVDGTLAIDFYCEGAQENTAFWWKEDAEGHPMDGSVQDQVHCNQYNSAGVRIGGSIGRTDGTNHYYLTAEVKRGCVYYFCSLPTNNAHEHPIIRLKSYAFMPNFRVTPLYKVVKNNEVANGSEAITHVAEIIGGPYADLNGQTYAHNYVYQNTDYTYDLTGTFTRNAETETRVKCLGNVVSAKAKVETTTDNENKIHQWLSFYDIVFRSGNNAAGEAYNPGGAVVAHVNGSEGAASFVLTIAYDAANAKWNDDKTQRVAATSNGTEVKRWDFYSGKGDYITKRNGEVSYNGGDTYTTETNSGWDLGKYGTVDAGDKTLYTTNSSAWSQKSKLFKEVNKADGQTADWEYDWVDVQNKKEPLYKSIYDMAGDNADMIHETAGLVFFTDPNELGIWNENEAPTSSFEDRFIGLMGGGKLIIPRLEANDRVVIKMGCFGNAESASRGTADFEQEAVLWLTNAKDAKGTVIPAETNYVIGGSTPYPNETPRAKTQPHGEYHFIVNQTSTSDNADFAIELKEGGLLKIYSIVIYKNADILTENSVTTADGPEMLFTDSDGNTKDMEFYLRYGGYEEPKAFNGVNNNYTRGNLGQLEPSRFTSTTDNTIKATFNKGDFGSFRADMAVKTKDNNNTYVTDYAPGNLAVGNLETMGYPYTWDFTDLSTYVSDYIVGEEGNNNLNNDHKGWINDNTHYMRNATEEEPGILFANGGQLWANTSMFAEAAGVGFKRSTVEPEDAKLLNNSVGVKSDGLVLNCAEEGVFHKLVIPNVPANAAVYVRATPITGDNVKSVAKYSIDGTTGTDFTPSNVTGSSDKIYAMKNTAEQNVELWLNGMEVKKIAVSDAPKKFNALGWASESRNNDIDASLTSYMTGKDIKTYIVKGYNTSEKTVTLEDVSDKRMPLAEEDGSANACILYNNTDKGPLNFFGENTGFHLFVPDMHDLEKTAASGSVMKAQLTEGTVPMRADEDGTANTKGNYLNYAFTYQYIYVDPDTGEELSGRGGVQTGVQGFYRIVSGGASSIGNQGYLPVYMPVSTTTPARFSILFEGMDEGQATLVKTLEDSEDIEESYFNLSGQQLSGKPNRSGLYIVNGKKVYIKNK